MSEDKKYYYLRIKENFYETDDIKILQAMDNGYLYSDILMKLYLKSLKTDGKLMFKEHIPYNAKMIATITNHNIDVVEKALGIFNQLGLIEILDNGAIYMLDIQNFIGQSSSEADRKREYRNRIEAEKNTIKTLLEKGQMSDKCPPQIAESIETATSTGQMSDISPPEIEIELEREIELETEIEKDDVSTSKDMLGSTYVQQIKALWNSLNLTSNLIKLTPGTNRYKMLKKRTKDYGKEAVLSAIENIRESKFLKGEVNDFEISFDWFIKPNNFIKVYEGKYKDKQEKVASKNNKSGNFGNYEQRSYDFEELEKGLLGNHEDQED